MLAVQALVLWVHLFSAVVFVGGSFFMWLVIVPASRLITTDEAERTKMVGVMAKRFGRLADFSLAVLVVTGLYNASWYLPSMSALFTTLGGRLLLAKSILVAVLITVIYVNNVYFGKRIVRLARERRFQELAVLRKRSRVASMLNLSLMLVILLLAVLMQFF